MVADHLAYLRTLQPDPPRDREVRENLAQAANSRAMARHGRPLVDWYTRWEREQEERDELLARVMGEG